ncbi:MAG: adenylyl-sulfate kinase [Pseudobdellovibrionaceae bacterium]
MTPPRAKTPNSSQRDLEKLRIVIVGHVDHGKSSLIGRLLYDTDSLPDGRFEEVKAASDRRGDVMEWSYLLDAFQAERDQAITIDTTQIPFATDKRDIVIIDAPGHTEFLRNMVSGAAQADAAILVVDAEEGLQEQTRRHAYLLSLIGLTQIGVVINKIDKVGFKRERFAEVAKDISNYLASLGLTPADIIPLSARHGDNIMGASDNLPWFEGPTLLDLLHTFETRRAQTAQPLRFPVQDIYRIEEKRVIVGRIESGILRVGEKIILSPTNEEATIKTIEVWPETAEKKVEARAGESIGITLDKPVFVDRGHVVSHENEAPMLSKVFRMHLFWLSNTPLKVGQTYELHMGTSRNLVTVQSIEKIISTDDLSPITGGEGVKRNQMANVTLRARDLISLDPFTENAATGRAVLYADEQLAGGGTLSMEGYADQRASLKPKSENIYKVDHLMAYDVRANRNGYRGGVYWFTGLSGAGKSTLAMKVEQALFEKGYQTYVLDGDNVRHGLNADLGFSPEDRAENIRRVGEVAALFADAGIICITAFISPYRSDRQKARAMRPERFNEIYIKASLDACENRDPKGLYKKARKGEIRQFTGIDSPYEEPENAEMTVDTENNDVSTCVAQIVAFIEEHVAVEPLTDTAKAASSGEKNLAR